MNSILTTYRHALSLLQRNFWALFAVTALIQLPATILSGVHASMPHRNGAYLPVFLFGLLLYPICEAASFSLLNRSSNETRWVEVVYRGVVSYTRPLVRVQLNEFALELVISAPFFFLFSSKHFQNSSVLMVVMVLAKLISNSKLSPGEAAVVREKCSGKIAVKRAWNMTSGRRFWYVAGCLVLWSSLSYVGYHATAVFGERRTEVVIVQGILDSVLGTVETVVTWCIYSHLLLLEAHPNEIARTDAADSLPIG